MKNLLVYSNKRKDFDAEHHRLAKIQIDNCHRLGWNNEDIIMATNFPYEYEGVKSIELPDTTICSVKDQTSKIEGIIYLFEQGYIQDTCWFHDFDAFQLYEITEEELQLDSADIGLTDYGWSQKWNTGSFFFTPKAFDIFTLIREFVYRLKLDEEMSLVELIGLGMIDGRHKRLDVTYNIGMNKVERNIEKATKPLKVLHFHPGKRNLLDKFRLLMPYGLVRIMDRHGYK